MAARFWLIKSEPAAYGWDDLVRDGETLWDGVRNHRAAMNLRSMQVGEKAFFYHSVTGKEIVGVAEIELVRQSRLSVAEIRPAEWQRICSMAKG